MKALIRSLLKQLGYRLESASRHGWTPDYLARICQAASIIDVGAATGTPTLYAAFPEADLYLFDPLTDYQKALEQLRKSRANVNIYYQAVGAENGRTEIQVDLNRLERSSIYERSSLTRRNGKTERRTIEQTTLDTFFAGHPAIRRPILLKIDTEGHELEVIRGAPKFLRHVDTVIAEVSVAKRFERSYRFEDLFFAMHENDFVLVDILHIAYRAQAHVGAVFMDAVFRKRPSEPTADAPGQPSVLDRL